MQYYYPTPGSTQTLSGIKEEAQKYVSKIKDALGKMSLGDKQLDETDAILETLGKYISALEPGTEKNDAAAQWETWTNTTQDLRSRLQSVKSDLMRSWDELKKVLGVSGFSGIGNLGLVWYVVVGIVAAALFAAGKLWNEIVNKTREINLKAKALQAVIEKKVPPEVLRDLKKEEGGGLVSMLPKIAIFAIIAFALPGFLKLGRRRA